MAKRPLIGGLVLVVSAVAWAQVPIPKVPAVPPPQQGRDTQNPVTVPGTALIEGTVSTGAAGQPADGVTVTLSGMELRNSRTTVTNDDGKFSFAALPAGTFTLRASKTGHVSANFGQKSPGRPGTAIVLAQGQQLKNLSLSLPKGGVVSGVIYDEKGRPSISTSVRVMRWTMQSGERALVSAGTGTSDDRGIYRIFGLAPGDYLVSATPRQTMTAMGGTGAMINVEISAGGEVVTPMPAAAAANAPVMGYAAVYYPGTVQPALAQSVKVAAAEERLGVDFQLQQVSLVRVTGQVLAPPGVNPSSVQVRLVDRSAAIPGLQQLTARAGRDGTFTFTGVPPGQYQLTATLQIAGARTNIEINGADPQAVIQAKAQEAARQAELQARGLASGDAGARRLWAQQDVQVDGGYSPNITLTLQEGMTITGVLSFDGAIPVPSPLTRVRISLAPHGQQMSTLGLATVNATADANGRFTFTGVSPGQYRIRATGAANWTLKSVVAGGKDALDYWVEVVPGENINNVTVAFGDSTTELKGTLQSTLGQPTADYSVVIFAADNRYWVPLARRMQSVRPSTDGKFSFRGLPAGDYRLAAVTDLEPGAWFDPNLLQELLAASVAVRLVDGQPIVQDLRVSGQ